MKPKSTLRHSLILAGSSLLAISSASAQATSATWDENNPGNWTTVTNWVGNTAYAEGTDNTATFGNTITADRVVTLDTGITIGNITASDTTHNYTISGANILTLDRSDATKPTINVTTSTRALTISSVIAGNDGLQKTGAGTLTFTSTSNNTFTGGFDISGGVVSVDNTTNANAFGASTNVITFTGNGTIYNTNNTYTKAVAVNDGVIATFKGANAENTIVNGIVSGSGEIQITPDSSTMSASFANTANTHTGKLWVGTTGNALNFTANSLADSSTGSLKVGVATGANQTTSFTLGTATNAPVTLTNRAVELWGGSGSATLSNNATLAANAFTITPDLTFTTVSSGNKNLTLSGTNTGANAFNGSIGNNGTSTTAITKTGGGVWTLGNAANGFTGLITVTQGTLNYASAGGSNGITFNNTTGTVTLNYTGSGQTMSGAINASTVTSGTVTLGSSGSGAVNYSNTGSLGTATSNTVRKLILSGTNTGNNILAGQWVNNTGTSNAATLTKNGAGTWVLTNSNTYTGATAVNGGVLLVNGDNSSATGLVTVANTATLGGTGTVGGSTTIQSGGTLAPGSSPGTLTFGASDSLTFNSGSIFAWEITTGSNTIDKVVGQSTGTLGGSGAVFNISSNTAYNTSFWLADKSWTDVFTGFTGAGSWSGIFSSITGTNLTWDSMNQRANASAGGYFTISGSTLNWTAIPEPTSALAGLLLGAGLLRRRRK